MSTKLTFFKLILIPIVVILTIVFGFNCSPTNKIKSGMSPKEVVQKFGEPDRKSILEGKLLREIKDNESDFDLKKYRFVYYYEKSAIQVWFQEGKVTGATKDGISIL